MLAWRKPPENVSLIIRAQAASVQRPYQRCLAWGRVSNRQQAKVHRAKRNAPRLARRWVYCAFGLHAPYNFSRRLFCLRFREFAAHFFGVAAKAAVGRAFLQARGGFIPCLVFVPFLVYE